MNAFAAASRALFRDANLTQAATVTRPGSAMSIATRAVLSTPDVLEEIGAGGAILGLPVLAVSIADVADLRSGDLITVDDGRAFQVRGSPLRDAHRQQWMAEVEDVT